jgi:single-strand DNA-binding protein
MESKQVILNHVTVSGNLVRDAEKKVFENATILNISIAINTGYMSKEKNWVEHASFVNVTGFGRMADKFADLQKGTPVIVEGKLKQERWENDNGKQSRIIISATKIQVPVKLESSGEYDGPPRKKDDGKYEGDIPKEEHNRNNVSDDDLPT